MKYPADIKKIHEEIQKKLFFMLPEKWDRLYLYASMIDRPGSFQTGEMFFYYFPKGFLRKNPVNVYEVPRKFDIDETSYFHLADELYKTIKKLREATIENKETVWSNMSIVVEDLKYKVIFNYEDLTSSELEIEERRLIWRYRYLKIPYASLNRKQREIINRYEKSTKQHETIYEMPLYRKDINKNFETIGDIEKKSEFVTEDKIEEMEFKNSHIPKSQILNMK